METKELKTSTPPETETLSELLYRTRSEEVQEIIGRMPSWIIRWGVTVIGLLVLGAFVAAALIKSPDVVNCMVTIAPAELPGIIQVSENRQIQKLLVKEGDHVDKGSPLAILDNSMNHYKAILEAKQVALAIDTSLHLKQVLERLPAKENVFPGQLQNAYVELMISARHYLNNRPPQGQEYQWQQEVRLNAGKLMAMCNNWEQQFLLLSTAGGQVNFLRTLHDETPVRANEAIIAIVKTGSTAVTVTGLVPLTSFSNIKEGQAVLIKSDDYSLQEFGMLKGKVSKRSAIPVNGFYTIEMTLINGLVTTTGKVIPCQSALSATGDIILQDKSLLQKLFEQY